MYIKAAASASSSVPRGTGFLDHYDVQLIKCRAIVLRLQEFLRILKILNTTSKRRSEARFIIPLTNYILALYGCLTLNISEPLSKKLLAISEFKTVPIPASVPAYDAEPVDIRIELATVGSDLEEVKKKVYNASLQGQILETAIKLTTTALQVAERIYGTSLTERTNNRQPDISGRRFELNEAAFDELIRPGEVALALDLAVLIKNYDLDTSVASFQKLNLQVLGKFRDHMNEKALRPIKSYHTSLFRFSKAASASQAKIIMNLPHWQYTMHRVYALLLRILYILSITKAFLRQIYIPNSHCLAAHKTQLRSTNVYEYQELLESLKRICLDGKDLDELAGRVNNYNNSGSFFLVQPATISEVFNTDITSAIRKLRHYFQTIDSWITMWTNIQDNNAATEKLDVISESELAKLLEERLANDKLEHIEKKNKEAAAKSEAVENAMEKSPPHKSTTQSTPIRTVFRRSSLQRSGLSPMGSEGSPPSSLSPRPLSRSPSLNNKRASLFNKVPKNGSNHSSPLVSRRGSVSENEQTTGMKSPVSAKPVGGANDRMRVQGRKRSASLQSALHAPSEPTSNTFLGDNIRSNSLQAGASLNQRMIRNSFAQVSGNLLGGSPTAQRGAAVISPTPRKKKPEVVVRSASPSPVSRDQSPSKSPSDSREIDQLPKIESLVLDNEKLALISRKDSPESNDSAATEPSSEAGVDGGGNGGLQDDSENQATDQNDDVIMKKVRFTGVPPFSIDEDPRPKRRGWYKKPAVLRYPPPPPQYAVQKYTLRQEGATFHNSLRENDVESNNAVQKRSSLIAQADMSGTTGHKLASKLRDKLIR
ncbi:LAFA_0C09208g1_1 [Lachancea sp. 'fantastica']|nr:LAFA_0C09208g1_1 [Lachancea sp. 'fantastica']